MAAATSHIWGNPRCDIQCALAYTFMPIAPITLVSRLCFFSLFGKSEIYTKTSSEQHAIINANRWVASCAVGILFSILISRYFFRGYPNKMRPSTLTPQVQVPCSSYMRKMYTSKALWASIMSITFAIGLVSFYGLTQNPESLETSIGIISLTLMTAATHLVLLCKAAKPIVEHAQATDDDRQNGGYVPPAAPEV